MKINQNPTRSLERILNQEFGGGTSLISEGDSVVLVPGATDQIQLSQLGNRLQLLVNGSDKFLLTESESKKFDIRGDLKNITIDPSVSLYSSKAASSESQVPLPGIVSERDEQLGHARRMESTFETAVTRGMMTEDIKEDRFVGHVGKQLQRLLGEMGSTIPQQTAFRSEKDLVPFLTQFESISGKAAYPFSADLKLTIQNIQKQINAGGAVNLEFLSSQVNGALGQMNKSIALTQPGRIPFEQHEIPLGETQRGALAKWGMINDAINNNDIEKIAAFAGDPSMLQMALPSEKSAFMRILAGAQDFKHEGIMNILQSAMNGQEYKTIMEMAGADSIRNIFKGNPGEYNITSDVFQGGGVLSPFLQGFTPQQIFAAAAGVKGAPDFENPLALAIASPEQKASMIQALQAGYVSMADNRSIINILQSAMNKTEFDQIVNGAGGKAIGLALQDPISLTQWNRLAGAYDRMDLTTDFVEGVKYSGALLGPLPFDMNETISFMPLVAGQILRGQSVGDVSGILDSFMKDAGDWVNVQTNVFSRGAFVQAGLENLNRMMGELPLLDIGGMRAQLSSAFGNAAAGPTQIAQLLQNFSANFGMSNFDLRNLITQPLGFAFQNVATESLKLLQKANAFFGENIEMGVFRYGADSAQVRSLKALIERAQTSFSSFTERSQSIAKLLSEAVPSPVDFVKSLTEFTADFGLKVAPALINLFPNNFEVLNRLLEKTQTIERLVNRQVEITQLSNPIASNVLQLTSQLKAATDGLESLRIGSLARDFSRVNQELLHVADFPRELIQLTKETTTFLNAIHDGSYAKVLSEAVGTFKKYDDPIADLTKSTAEQGIAFLSQLINGGFSKTNEDFTNAINKFQNAAADGNLNKFFEQLTSLTGGMISGSADLAEEVTTLLTDVANGKPRGSFNGLIKAEAEFRQSPAFRKLVDLLEGGGKFLKALSSGHFQQNMEMMNSRFGYSPAIAQIIERGQHLTSIATNVTKALVARDFERPIAQATKKSQAKTQAAKDLPDVETIFSQAATTFYALTEVDHMDFMWQYHRQLDLLNDSAFKLFEKQAQLLTRDPDLKNSVRSQLKSFRNLL